MIVYSKIIRQALVHTSRSYATSQQAAFETHPFKLHKLDNGPPAESSVTREDALNYYRKMQMIRRMETSANSLYKEKKIRGFCHLYTGQEACAVGIVAAMDKEDAVITAYRCHGWTYLCGATPTDVLAELTGKIGGNVYGKGGSMHMYAKNFFGGNGIVGAQQPLGTGIAFAMKYRGQKNVCYTLYGDGAANQGQLFESTNMAKLWNLPVIYICENNGFGMGTSAQRSSASTEYYTRGDFVPGIWVDGMDVITVREAFKWAREWSIQHGPLMVELSTYRYYGHSMSDPGTSYRTREEIQEVRKLRDPITHFRERMITAGLASKEELDEMDKEIRKEIDQATNEALNDDVLPREALYADIYTDTPAIKIRGTTPDSFVEQPHLTTAEIVKSLGRTVKTY